MVKKDPHHIRVVGLILSGDAMRGVAVARTASTHDHVVHGVVILLLDLRPVVQQVVTCSSSNTGAKLTSGYATTVHGRGAIRIAVRQLSANVEIRSL